MRRWIRSWRWLHDIAEPLFDCEDCIGMSQHGCYCTRIGASGPCIAPTWQQRVARWLRGGQ